MIRWSLCTLSYVSQTAISKSLSVPLSTVHDDVMFLRQKAREYVQDYASHFSLEYTGCLKTLAEIQLIAINAVKSSKYERNLAPLLNACRDIVLARAALLCDTSLVNQT